MIEKLTEIVREHTGSEDLVLTENTNLLTDLGLNSFDLVNMVVEVEDAFDIEIPDRVIKDFRTVGDVIAFIEEQ